MVGPLIDILRRSADKLGLCDPHWLKSDDPLTFTTVEPAGSGPELLLLHGLLGALSNWDSSLPLFAKFSRPIALSFPLLSGHRSEVKIRPLALYTEYFIRQRALAPVAVCGNSLGGHVAMRLCLAAPEMVDLLILTGTSGLYEHSVDTLPVRMDKKFIREHMSRVFFHQKFVTEEAIDEIHKILVNRKNVLNLIHAARSAKKDNMLTLLKDIKVPTLLLWGEDDVVTTMDVAETFHRNIPNSKLVTIKGCGHAPMIEHPDWFAEEVNKFMQQHSRYSKVKPAK